MTTNKVNKTNEILLKLAGSVIVLLLGAVVYFQQKEAAFAEKVHDTVILVDKKVSVQEVEASQMCKEIGSNTTRIKQNEDDISNIKKVVKID